MEDKIWFTFQNNNPYPYTEGVILVSNHNPNYWIKEIKESIDAFNREIKWGDMWDLEEAAKRFANNETLFLLRDDKGSLGHVWFDEDCLYNMFISNRRESGTSVKFILHCFNYVPYKDIKLYCDKWNKKAQKFFKKVGAKEISSYL